jgi:hypothetical protein
MRRRMFKKITPAMLVRRGANRECWQYEVFCKQWPDGVVPSLKAFKAASSLYLDLDWFADAFLSKAGIDRLREEEEIFRGRSQKAMWAAWRRLNKSDHGIAAEDSYSNSLRRCRRIEGEAKAAALWKEWKKLKP